MKKNKSLLLIGIIVGIVIIGIVGVFWYMQGAETRKATADNVYIQSQIRLAENKLVNGELIESQNILKTAKSNIEVWLYNEKVNPKYIQVLQGEYNEINNKLKDIGNQLESINEKVELQNKFTQYSKDYDDFLKEEQNITTEYKYNPKVITNLSGKSVDHCADLMSKILNNKTKITTLQSNILDLNIDTNTVGYSDLLQKVSKSKELFDLMYLDYTNWCDTRKILQEVANFENKYSEQADKYYYCTEKDYSYKLLNSETQRHNFLISADFNQLRNIIMDKQYPFDISLQNISQSSLDGAQYNYDLFNLYCDYAQNATINNNAILTVSAKCKSYDDSILSSDRSLILTNLKNGYESCYELLKLKPDCINLKEKYPELVISLDCDFSSKQAICDYQKNTYLSWKSKGAWDCLMGIEYNLVMN